MILQVKKRHTYIPFKRSVAGGFLMLLSIFSTAQTDTLGKQDQQLGGVTITGSKKILFDPALRPRLDVAGNGSLAQTLQEQNVLFLKTYGPGLLSTVSSRGMEAVHTPVIWHGFSMQNTVNGTPDPAIESVPGNYRAAFYPGGQSGLYGSGAIGGTLQLNPTFSEKKGINAAVGLEFGSFGRQSQNFHLGFQNDRTSVSGELRLNKVKNDFPFVNRTQVGKPTQRMANAATAGTSFNTDFRHRFKKGGEVTASVWYQFNRRQIPSTMITTLGNAIQMDESVRSMVGWSGNIKRGHNLSVKTAFLYDLLFYDDDALAKPSHMVQYASLSRVEYDHAFGQNHRVFAGLNHSYYKTFLSEYDGFSPQRNQTALFVGYKYNLPKNLGEAAVQAVEEFTDGRFTPFCPALSVLLKPKPFLPVRIRVNRNYRQPNFNDLYWVPGGNPHLKPETSFSQEAGLGFEKTYDKKSGKYDVSAFATGFHNTVNNRIVWIPGPIFWAPENIDRTRAYGAEVDLKAAWNKTEGKHTFGLTLSGNYSYTRSVRAKARFENDPAFGKQLAYIPVHLGSAGIEFRYRNTAIYYRHRFTGKRYTIADNSLYVAGFQLGNIGITQTVNVMGFTVKLWFVCENVGNVSYEVLEYRPMPGRFYRGGLSISFNKNFSKNYE